MMQLPVQRAAFRYWITEETCRETPRVDRDFSHSRGAIGLVLPAPVGYAASIRAVAKPILVGDIGTGGRAFVPFGDLLEAPVLEHPQPDDFLPVLVREKFLRHQNPLAPA